VRKIQGNTEMPLKELVKLVIKREDKLTRHLAKLQKEIDDLVFEIYEISPEDRKLIEKELGRMQGEEIGEEIPPEIRRLFPPLKSPTPVEEKIRIQEHVKRLLSWYAKRVILADDDGIVPLNKTFEDNLYDRIVDLMEKEWGEERVQKLLDEIYKILGKTLERWLFDDYFPYHLSLYKNRPIFWLLGTFQNRRKDNPPFACFLNFHKLTPDTLPKVRMLYLSRAIEETKIQYDNNMEDYSSMDSIAQIVAKLRENLSLLEDLDRKIEGLTKPANYLKPPEENASWLERKIYEITERGYHPVLDYGVLVNITPLKKSGILHKASERVK